MDGNPAETRAAAAKVVTAVCNHNKGHQMLLVGRNVMPPLVDMLAAPTLQVCFFFSFPTLAALEKQPCL